MFLPLKRSCLSIFLARRRTKPYTAGDTESPFKNYSAHGLHPVDDDRVKPWTALSVTFCGSLMGEVVHISPPLPLSPWIIFKASAAMIQIRSTSLFRVSRKAVLHLLPQEIHGRSCH